MTSTPTDSGPAPTQTGSHSHDHPSDWQYVKVAILLGVITAVEVGTYFIELTDLVVGSLYVMMIAKFFVVGAYFMHLKYDSNIFRWVFLGGLLLAIGVYLVTFGAFGFFGGDFV